jgi:hypothetical protein
MSSLGDAKSSLGDAKSSLGDAKSSLGDAKSSLGDAKSSLGDATLTRTRMWNQVLTVHTEFGTASGWNACTWSPSPFTAPCRSLAQTRDLRLTQIPKRGSRAQELLDYDAALVPKIDRSFLALRQETAKHRRVRTPPFVGREKRARRRIATTRLGCWGTSQ